MFPAIALTTTAMSFGAIDLLPGCVEIRRQASSAASSTSRRVAQGGGSQDGVYRARTTSRPRPERHRLSQPDQDRFEGVTSGLLLQARRSTGCSPSMRTGCSCCPGAEFRGVTRDHRGRLRPGAAHAGWLSGGLRFASTTSWRSRRTVSRTGEADRRDAGDREEVGAPVAGTKDSQSSKPAMVGRTKRCCGIQTGST